MRLTAILLSKADRHLADALSSARPDDILTAVLLLNAPSESCPLEKLNPSDFGSREAFRRALIQSKQRQIHDDYGDTIEALKKLSLNPQGGELTRTVVVRGTAEEIASALELPTVAHGSLDRPMQMVMSYGAPLIGRSLSGISVAASLACGLLNVPVTRFFDKSPTVERTFVAKGHRNTERLA